MCSKTYTEKQTRRIVLLVTLVVLHGIKKVKTFHIKLREPEVYLFRLPLQLDMVWKVSLEERVRLVLLIGWNLTAMAGDEKASCSHEVSMSRMKEQ